MVARMDSQHPPLERPTHDEPRINGPMVFKIKEVRHHASRSSEKRPQFATTDSPRTGSSTYARGPQHDERWQTMPTARRISGRRDESTQPFGIEPLDQAHQAGPIGQIVSRIVGCVTQ